MASFTHYKQLDAMDCGPTCLRMVARYYGKSYTLQYLRGLSHITREGVSMLGISDAAEAICFRTKGYRLTCEQLHLVFSVYEDEESKKLINAVYRIYTEKGHSETLRFIEGWYGAAISQRKKILNNIDLNGFDIARQVGETNGQLFKQYSVAGTPTVFVNGYLFPREYEFSDIEIYIDEIKQLK